MITCMWGPFKIFILDGAFWNDTDHSLCKQLHDIIKLFRLTLHVVNGKKKIRLPTDLSVTFDA